MLTKNWIKGFKLGLRNGGSETFTLLMTGEQKSGQISNITDVFFTGDKNVITSLSSASRPNGVAFGNGTGVVNENDYNLFGECVKGINCTAVVTCNQDGSNISKEIEYTVSNTNSSDVTITEIAYVTAGLFNNTWQPILLDHTLLDEPVTIPAGGVGQVTYTFNFNIA